MMDICPTCDKSYDADGWWEHGVETLWLCDCGTILSQEGDGLANYRIVQVKRDEVDLTGLDGRSRLFVKRTRWKRP